MNSCQGRSPKRQHTKYVGCSQRLHFNPIEMAFSKLKAFLKKTAARTKDDLWDAIAQGIDTFTTKECQNYFAAAGYECE